MELYDLQSHWNAWGTLDPLWAILSDPVKKDGRWDAAAFFQTGQDWVNQVMSYVDGRRVPMVHGRALDFGCGVGRLTQALCHHFSECHGVDIAESMLERAKSFNRHGNRCQYHLNKRNDLSLFETGSFNFIYSIIVLQHMRPRYSRRYIAEFIRLLSPAGLAIFQLPTESVPTDVEGTANGQSAALGPMTDSAFRVDLALANTVPVLEVGSQHIIRVRVKNASGTTWPMYGTQEGDFCVKLGHHWLDGNGIIIGDDDAHVVLPWDLMPGAEVVNPHLITAPVDPGRWILELDMVQQGVAWFKDKGCQPRRVFCNVTVQSESSVDRLRTDVASPVIQMYGIPRQDVVKLIADCGGKIVDIRPDHMGGKHWLSNTYCLTK